LALRPIADIVFMDTCVFIRNSAKNSVCAYFHQTVLAQFSETGFDRAVAPFVAVGHGGAAGLHL
jgi:hypothetical protein